jgi:hypothetical protein
MALWRPDTLHVTGGRANNRRWRLLLAARPGPIQRLSYSATHAGGYDLELQLRKPGAGQYKLDLTTTPVSTKPRPSRLGTRVAP